jgi:hypothetical protein
MSLGVVLVTRAKKTGKVLLFNDKEYIEYC